MPVIRIADTLVASVLEELGDSDALALQSDLNGALERTGATAVLLDVTSVETIDSFLGRLLNEIAVGARLLGAETVVVGIQPAVAVTLVELGLDLKGVRTALDVERGLKMLGRGMGRGDAPERRDGR